MSDGSAVKYLSCNDLQRNTLSLAEKMRCPLCGKFNRCGMLVSHVAEPCWCHAVQFSDQVLAAIPEEKRGLQCLCFSCAKG